MDKVSKKNLRDRINSSIKASKILKFKWVEIVKEHFIKTKYDLGLNKCLNKIDNIIN